MNGQVDSFVASFIDFENVAIWAEENFYDLDLKRIMEYLQSRGSVVIKKAYGDWSRFSTKYRDDLVDNSIDLIQMYSIRAGKNRADIRLALDAFEAAMHRPQIGTIAIISGDSDFGELASKLREYGKYIIGIGPKAITHPLLVKSCDEFIYLETMLGREQAGFESSPTDQESARKLLLSALSSHGKRGELPVPGTKLKQTLLSMDSTFNEANLGFNQLRTWLEDNGDLVNLYFKGLQMYVAPKDFVVPDEFTSATIQKTTSEKVEEEQSAGKSNDYRDIYNKVVAVDMESRRDILRAIYRELSNNPGKLTYTMLLDRLQGQFENKGSTYSKSLLRKVMQLGYHQQAYQYLGPVSVNTPMKLAEEIDSQAKFIQRAETRYPYAVIQAGLEVDPAEISSLLLADSTQTGYVRELLDDLEARGSITKIGDGYRMSGQSENPLLDDPYLEQILEDIKGVALPADLERSVTRAKELATSALSKRTHDFSAATQDFLLACRLQWDAFEKRDDDATLEDLRWYIASYASVKAGELAQVFNNFELARSYYVAFFSLVQEDTPLWDRMRGLINPMLSFYWKNLARELSIELDYTTSPVNTAIQLATTENAELREKWLEATKVLAMINPSILQRVANNIRLLTGEARSSHVADTIESMINGESLSDA